MLNSLSDSLCLLMVSPLLLIKEAHVVMQLYCWLDYIKKIVPNYPSAYWSISVVLEIIEHLLQVFGRIVISKYCKDHAEILSLFYSFFESVKCGYCRYIAILETQFYLSDLHEFLENHAIQIFGEHKKWR